VMTMLSCVQEIGSDEDDIDSDDDEEPIY
jgi:hypothetical protein